MKPNRYLLLALGAAGLLAAGCVPVSESVESATRTVVTGHEGGAYAPRNATKYDLENKLKLVLLDKDVERSVTCSGLFEKFTDDGRLQITANMRNRLNRRIQVQINCVFKDALGAPVGDETPFETFILDENAQEGKTFKAMNAQAKGYTIRVRQAR